MCFATCGLLGYGDTCVMPWEDICECDVVDKERLALFRAKLARWKECVVGRDAHSIESQISTLLWDDVVFRTFNEARLIHVEARDPSMGYFGTVIELLDKNSMDAQVMAIRRLTDRHNPDSFRAVVSFPTIVAEIREAQDLYTREDYVCYDGAPYEEASAEDQEAAVLARMRHHKYDLLAGCLDSERSRQNRVSPAVLGEFEEDRREFQVLKAYANKYLAHAADPANRGDAQSVPDKVSLRAFDVCYRSLFRMASIVGSFVDEFILCEPPVPQFNALKHWDKPIVASAQLPRLRQYWDDRVAEIKRWEAEAKLKSTG